MTNIISIDQVRNFSYTRCAADEECRFKRYLSREWGGTGLQPILAGWSLVFGNIIHRALEDFAKSGQCDLKSVRENTIKQAQLSGLDAIQQRDWATLAVNMIRGFQRYVWPALMGEYEVIETEKWIEYTPISGFKFRARQDLLLRNKFDGHLCYVDYKTTSTNKPQWIKSWSKSVQLHSSMYAMRRTTGHQVERAIVIGFNKGYDDAKLHTRRSILNYGWVNRQFSMTPEYSYEYKKSKGWELFAANEEFEGSEWVDNMPTEILSEQFPQTGPIFVREDIAETWFRQQLIREQEVADALQQLETVTDVLQIQPILDKYFKQNFSHCEPAYGYDCEFKNYCWIPHVNADPLGSGQFKRYESDIEVE